MGTVIVELPLPGKAIASNARNGHWGQRKASADVMKSAAANVLRSVARQLKEAGIGAGHVYWYAEWFCAPNPLGRDGLHRPKDKNNALTAMKYAEDALKIVGLVKDDSADYVTPCGASVYRDKARHKGKSCILWHLSSEFILMQNVEVKRARKGPSG